MIYICRLFNVFDQDLAQSHGSIGIPSISLILWILVSPNRHLFDLSSSTEENMEIEDKSETSSRSKIGRSTRGQNIRKKFNKHMQFFLAQRGSCSYDDETKDDIKVPLR